MAALLGDALPPDLVLAIEERSDGNPLFIEELIRSWVAVGTLESEAGSWRLTRPPGAVVLPSTVQAIYAGQLDDLPPPVRDVARRASVAGRRFPADALEALGVEAPGTGVEGLLARALVSGPIADAVTGPGFAYRHALLRDAGYSSLGRADRARLHVRLARWLESVAGDGRDAIADRIGGHYEAALATAPALAVEVDDGLSRPTAAATAAAWLERAADRALALGARDAAVDLLQRCLALTAPADGIDAARRMLRLATTTGASGDLGEALRLAERSEAIHRDAFRRAAPGSSDHAVARDGYARASDARAEMESEQLHFLEARAIAEAALAELDDVHDTPWARLRLRIARAMSLWDDTYDIAAVEEVLVIARRDGDPILELEALWSLTAFSDDTAAVAEARLAHLAELAAAQGQWQYVAYARRAQGMSAAFAGGDPWPLIDASADVAAAHGLREHLAWAEYFRAETGLMLGEWDIADAAARRAIGLAETYAYHRVGVRTWFALAPIAAARDDRPTLEHAASYFTAHAADFPDSPYGRLMHRGIDELVMRAGTLARTEVSFDRLAVSFDQDVDGPTSSEAVWLVTSGWLQAGRYEDVRSAIERIRAGFATLPTSDLIRGVVELLEAHLRLCDRSGDAVEPARSGLTLVRGMRATWWVRRALRLLERAGGATPDELAEAEAIECPPRRRRSEPLSRSSARAIVRRQRARWPGAARASSIAGVSLPVNVFCWLGWKAPSSTYGPMRASAPCPKRGRGRGIASPMSPQRAQRPVPAERAQADDDPDVLEQRQLAGHVRQAAVAFGRRRLVGRRRAAHDGGDPGVGQDHAVVALVRVGLRGEADRVERGVQEVARAVAGEHAPRPVAAMGAGRQADEQDAGADVAEAGHRPRPVLAVAEAGDLLARDPLAPLDEARAAPGRRPARRRGRRGPPVARRARARAGPLRAGRPGTPRTGAGVRRTRPGTRGAAPGRA